MGPRFLSPDGPRDLRVGLDLDGTIVVYDDVFRRHAVEEFAVPAAAATRKGAIRDWMRANAPGEAGWIELQRLVYGVRILDAPPAPGVLGFLRDCRELGVPVTIVSHKTRLSAAAPQVDLHAAAIRWLRARGIFDLIGRDRVFFEPTRAGKLRRIESEGCSLFVDDLEEVLVEPAFPSAAERWLYAPGAPDDRADGVRVFTDWQRVGRRVRERLGARS